LSDTLRHPNVVLGGWPVLGEAIRMGQKMTTLPSVSFEALNGGVE